MTLAPAYDVPQIMTHPNHRYLDDNAYESAAYLCKQGHAALFAPTLQVIRNFQNCSDDIMIFPLLKNGKK